MPPDHPVKPGDDTFKRNAFIASHVSSRLRFRPTLWPTIFTVAALILLISLGNWQVRRLHWKEGLIASRAAALSAPPHSIPRSLPEARLLEFHHVFADGTYLNDKELFLHAEDANGSDGFQIVTPLQLTGGDILLINRGFVPARRKDPAARRKGLLSGQQRVEGILRLSVHPHGWLVPESRPADDFWLFVDVPAMAAADRLPAEKVLPFFVEAGSRPNPGGLPVGGQTRVELPNDHLQYAVTWYLFAATLIVVYVAYHLKRAGKETAS